jgi:hypothetical protein
MPAPSDLALFFTYMRAFETACLSGDWSPVAARFAPDARHDLPGGGPFGASTRGRDAVVAGLRASVEGVDRRFDARIPEIVEGPVPTPDGVVMRYALTLRRAGLPDLRFEGDHRTVFESGRIVLLEDVPAPDTAARAETYLATHGAKLRPSGSPFAPPTAPADLADLDAAVGRSLARSYGHAKSRRDIGATLALCHEDFRLDTVSLGVVAQDRKETEQQLGLFFRAFPDYRVTLDGMASSAGTTTAWGTAQLTFDGDFLGAQPTGRSATLPFFSVFTHGFGGLTGERFFFDRASLCEQIGLPLEAVAKLAQQVSR